MTSGVEELTVRRNFTKEISFDMCIYKAMYIYIYTHTLTHIYTLHSSPVYAVQVGTTLL